ncbi:MAG: hypothetical protein QM487_04660 [Candidatus Marithrix sp.]
MQPSIDISNVINLISCMNLSQIEEIKNALIEREIFFQRFKKDNIENVIDDFKNENYSENFLNVLENGLKKSSIYNENSLSISTSHVGSVQQSITAHYDINKHINY